MRRIARFAPVLCLAGLGPMSALRAQAEGPVPAASVRFAPAGMVAVPSPRLAPRLAGAARVTHAVSPAPSSAARRRAFHVGALAGAVLLGATTAMLAQPWARADGGDDEAGRPGMGFVLMGAGTGALFGGIAGIIVHDVRCASRSR